MKKYNLIKVIAITVLVGWVLTLIIPGSSFDYSGNISTTSIQASGLWGLFSNLGISISYFNGIAIFIIAVACFYSVLGKLEVYNNFVSKVADKFSAKTFVIISTIFIILSPDIANKTVSSLDSSIDLKTSTYKEIALVMGTSYGPRGAGWHNGWYEPYLYKQYGTNTDAMRKDGIKRTINNLNTLVHDHKLLDFYHDKICSMYINPDYQGFWTISANKAQQFGKGNPQAQSFLWITYDKENDIYSHFTSSFMTGKVNQLIIFYENILMNVIYLGALCYILCNRKKMTTEKIFIPLIFIGCFLFFLLWEAKGQYSILFYILLFPLTAEGIEQLAKVIVNNRK